MRHVYEPRVRNARSLLADVLAGRPSLPGGTTGPYGRYKRLTHYGRIVDAQDSGIHRILLLDESTATCTCSLRVPIEAWDPFRIEGHVDTQKWEPVEVLLAFLEPEVAMSERRLVVVCLRCRSSGPPISLDEAAATLSAHQHEDQ